MFTAVLCGLPCLLVLIVAALISAHRVLPDIKARHRKAVYASRGCAEQRELARHLPTD